MTTFSPAPNYLLDHHRQHLRTSGLTDETIAGAGIYSETRPAEIGRLLGWTGAGPAPAIVFPYLDRLGQAVMAIVRPDQPRQVDGKPVKYESPVGVPPRLYFAPARLMDPAAILSPTQPLLLVEGIKKALKALEAGAPAVISAQGTTVWHDIQRRKGTDERVLHADFTGIPLKDREVFIAFDGGDTSVNAPVILAEAQLARMLHDAGALVRVLRIPSRAGEKLGLDDYLAQQADPRAALQALYANAQVADPLVRARAIRQAQDPAVASLALLRDLSFGASLHVRDRATLDLVADELKASAKLSKTSIEEAVEGFKQRMRRGAQPVAQPAANRDLTAEAEQLLLAPDLVPQFLAALAEDGLVGEQDGALLLLLVVVTRDMPDPIHLALKAASSSGKNFLVRIVMRFVPPECVEEISEMTPAALQYLPESLDGKVVVFTEHEGAERAQYPLRIAMSERKLKLWVPEKVKDVDDTTRIKTQPREVSCSASFITTTTKAKLVEDNETRILEVTLDESSEQTERINLAQAEAAARPRPAVDKDRLEHTHKVWQQLLRILKPLPVLVPQAHTLRRDISSDRVRARRDLPKLLELVKAHALLHQRQRVIRDGYVIATDEDVAVARRLTMPLRKGIAARLYNMAAKLEAAFGIRDFTAREATKVLGYSDPSRTSKILAEMLDEDLVESADPHRGNRPALWRMATRGRQWPPHVSPPPNPTYLPNAPTATTGQVPLPAVPFVFPRIPVTPTAAPATGNGVPWPTPTSGTSGQPN